MCYIPIESYDRASIMLSPHLRRCLPSLFGGFLNATPVDYIATAVTQLGMSSAAYVRATNTHHVLLSRYDVSIQQIRAVLKEQGYFEAHVVAPNDWRARIAGRTTSAVSAHVGSAASTESSMVYFGGYFQSWLPCPDAPVTAGKLALAAFATHPALSESVAVGLRSPTVGAHLHKIITTLQLAKRLPMPADASSSAVSYNVHKKQ